MPHRLINQGVNFLRDQGEPINSVLDIGIKDTIVTEKYNSLRDVKIKVGIDLEEKYLKRGVKLNKGWTLLKMDAKKITNHFIEDQFDVIILNDVIEHLTKKDGKKLLEDCKKIGYYIMLFTPSGHLKQKNIIKTQNHLSGWSEQELKDAGFNTTLLKGYHAIFKEGTEEIERRHDAIFAFRYRTKNIASNED